MLCAWTAARARDLRPGMRRHLRADGRALRGAARGGRAPMLLSGLWDDGTTAAQLPVHGKTNEIPVFRDLLDKIPAGDLKDAVISADQMHTQRKHAEKIQAACGFFIFTIGDNQEKLFDAADALPWRAFAGEAWTVDRGHGRIDVRPGSPGALLHQGPLRTAHARSRARGPGKPPGRFRSSAASRCFLPAGAGACSGGRWRVRGVFGCCARHWACRGGPGNLP